MALEGFIFDNNNVNLITSLLQILGLGESIPRLFPKVVAHSELNERLLALNYSGKAQSVWLALGKRFNEFLLKQRRLVCAGQNSALDMLQGIL
jgi:hypothetical protein